MPRVPDKMSGYPAKGFSRQGGSRSRQGGSGASVRIPSCSRKPGAVSAPALGLAFSIRLLAASVLFASAFQTLARDVSMEQSAVQFARQEFKKAEAEHQSDLEQMESLRKALEPLKKQFEQEQNKARLSQNRKQQAKARLEQAQRALDRAWKQ